MKYTLTLAAVILVFAVVGCKKKPTANRCYVCNRYELVWAPIFVQFNQPRKLVSVDTVCNMNEETIQLYMDTHKHLDTLKAHTYPVDTILLNQHSSECSTQ